MTYIPKWLGIVDKVKTNLLGLKEDIFLKEAIDFKNIFSEIFIDLNESLKHHL